MVEQDGYSEVFKAYYQGQRTYKVSIPAHWIDLFHCDESNPESFRYMGDMAVDGFLNGPGKDHAIVYSRGKIQ